MKAGTLFSLLGAGAIAFAQDVTTTMPAPAETSLTARPVTIGQNINLDGEGMLYDRKTNVCRDSASSDRKDAIFILEDGAALHNVTIGPNQGRGIHCLGSCTLTNVWFTQVCQVAVTAEGEGSQVHISGGGAVNAADKVLVQATANANVTVEHFYAKQFGSLVETCGNCTESTAGPRTVVIDNVVAIGSGSLCGIYTNRADTCHVSNTCHSEGNSCHLFEKASGEEGGSVGQGPDDMYCFVEGLSTIC